MELLKICFEVVITLLAIANTINGQFFQQPQHIPAPKVTPGGFSTQDLINNPLGTINKLLESQKSLLNNPQSSRPNPYSPLDSGSSPFAPPNSGSNNFPPLNSGPNPFAPQNSGSNPFAPQNSGSNPFVPQNSGSNPFAPQNSGSNPFAPLKSAPNPFVPQNSGSNPFAPQNSGFNPFAPQNSAPNPFAPQNTGSNPFAPQNSGLNHFAPQNSGPNPFAPQNSGPNPFAPQNSGRNPFAPQNSGQNLFAPQTPGTNPFDPQNSGPIRNLGPSFFSPQNSNLNQPNNPILSPFNPAALNIPQNPNPNPFVPLSRSLVGQQNPSPAPFIPPSTDLTPPLESVSPNTQEETDLIVPQDSNPSATQETDDDDGPKDSDSASVSPQNTDEPQEVPDSEPQDTSPQDDLDSGPQVSTLATAQTSPKRTGTFAGPRHRITGIHRIAENFFPGRSRNRARGFPYKRRKPSANSLGRFRIVCLFNNLHYYRGEFTPALLDPRFCTHLNYEFAILDPKTYEIMTGEPELDVEMNFYQEAIDLKKRNRRLKVLLSLGGWNDSTKKYSELAAAQDKWDNFITKAIDFLKSHEFDGLDFAWEYPNCWQGAIGVSPKDKKNFVNLLRAVKPKFKANGLLLSVSVGAIKREIEAAYDVKGISDTVDYMNVMTYDMHGPWESVTGHHTQFSAKEGDADPDANVKSSMKIWMDKGADKTKLNMGIAMYGRTYTMASPDVCELGVPSIGIGKAGSASNEGGFLLYNEICNNLKNKGWIEKEDKEAGFYACGGDQLVCYDNTMMMVKKARWVVDEGLGGLLMKDLSGEDFKGDCFNMSFPLLKMAKMEMMQRIHQLGL